jgi:hypothetical protein
LWVSNGLSEQLKHFYRLYLNVFYAAKKKIIGRKVREIRFAAGHLSPCAVQHRLTVLSAIFLESNSLLSMSFGFWQG